MGRAKFLRLRLGRVLLWLALAVVIATIAITFVDQSARLKELQKEQGKLETVREELALEKGPFGTYDRLCPDGRICRTDGARSFWLGQEG